MGGTKRLPFFKTSKLQGQKRSGWRISFPNARLARALLFHPRCPPPHLFLSPSLGRGLTDSFAASLDGGRGGSWQQSVLTPPPPPGPFPLIHLVFHPPSPPLSRDRKGPDVSGRPPPPPYHEGPLFVIGLSLPLPVAEVAPAVST